jgi:hypothetical protein
MRKRPLEIANASSSQLCNRRSASLTATFLSPHETTADGDLLVRVSAEFREMPDLTVTVREAVRLFAVDLLSCERILGTLVRGGILATDGRVFFHAGSGRRSA